MRIVIADGHPNFRSVLVELLTDDGHEVRAVAGGGELVSVVRADPPDVLVAHARFADLSALDALELLAQHEIVPTILMTGDIHSVNRSHAERLGVVSVIEKPFPIAQLRDELARIASLSAA